MNDRRALLITFTDALTAGQSLRFDGIVKAAYQAGATREDLLKAVEVGRRLAPIAGPVASQAYASIHNWHWIAARRAAPPGTLAPQPA